MKEVFKIYNPDFDLSPHTGMGREHWKDAAMYLLKGSFSHVGTFDAPMKFPRQPGKSYPYKSKRFSPENLEGLCRTLLVAVPLLKETPDLMIGTISVADYYRHHLLNLADPDSRLYIRPRSSGKGPSQILVEFGTLALLLALAPEILWEPLPESGKKALAEIMLSYGDGPTIDSNWRFFNIFILSFFQKQGYEVDDTLLGKYLAEVLEQYRGFGWYNDNPAYDYYSMWSFQLYGILWSRLFGKEWYPEISEQLQKNFDDLADHYPYIFSRSGEMIMWGRSISYRMAAAAPLPFMGRTGSQTLNSGWMRRIASGVILQFLQNPEVMQDNVPALGFYGPFEPAVQIYSCRASAFWMGKVFLGLLLPSDNPFWTAGENEGPWKYDFRDDQVYNKFQAGSDILITDYPGIGASEVRARCHDKKKDDWQGFRSGENYNRLAYNSAFPWQADGPDGTGAMNYFFKIRWGKWEPLHLYTFRKFEDGIYYRDAELEGSREIRMQLADIPLPNGILRVDRNISSIPVKIRLGHYALPKLESDIVFREESAGGLTATIVDNGKYQLAIVPVYGWEKTEVVYTEGLHPVSQKSAFLNVSGKYIPERNCGIYSVLMLWKESGMKWRTEELFPLKGIECKRDMDCVRIKFCNGMTFQIEYEKY